MFCFGVGVKSYGLCGLHRVVFCQFPFLWNMAVINPLERKLAKRTSEDWCHLHVSNLIT